MKIPTKWAFLLLLLPLLLFLMPINGSFMKDSIKETLDQYGYNGDIGSIKAKVTGSVIIHDLVVTDSLKNVIQIKKIKTKSSLFRLLKMHKKIKKKELDIIASSEDRLWIQNSFKNLHCSDVLGIVRQGDQKIAFDNATLLVQNRKKETHLTYSCPSVMGYGYILNSVSGKGVYKDALIRFETIKASFTGGSVELKGNYLLDKQVVQDLSVVAENISLEKLTKTPQIQGKATLNLVADTTALIFDSIAASGSFVVDSFSQDNHKYFKTALHNLKKVGIKKLDFQNINGTFVVKDGTVNTDDLTMDNETFTLTASGNLSLDKLYFNCKVTGFLDNSMQPSVDPVVWGALLPAKEKGARYFTGTARGVVENYRVAVDKEFIGRGVKSFFSNIFK